MDEDAESYVRTLLEQANRLSGCFAFAASIPDGPVGILGAGLMGTAIAATLLRNGISVKICDVSEETLARCDERIAAEIRLQGGFSGTKNTAPERAEKTRDPAGVRDCGIVIESIPEKLKLKQKSYRQLDRAGFSGFLFTNTSTIEIARLIESRLENADRFCGFHFFHPVRKRSLLEIVRGTHTAEKTLAIAGNLARRLEKTPLLVQDGPGFLVNRLLHPYLSEAIALSEQGIPFPEIEHAARRFGMEMGPFRIMDEIGLDVTLHAGWTMNQAFPDRADRSTLLVSLLDRGRLGRKSGRGFLRYTSDHSWDGQGSWDENDELLQRTAASRFLSETESDEIARRLVYPMIAESVRAVEEGIVDHYRETDLAVVLGLGFPKHRGGPCFWADSLGLKNVVATLRDWESRFGPRFQVPKTLELFAETDQRLVQR